MGKKLDAFVKAAGEDNREAEQQAAELLKIGQVIGKGILYELFEKPGAKLASTGATIVDNTLTNKKETVKEDADKPGVSSDAPTSDDGTVVKGKDVKTIEPEGKKKEASDNSKLYKLLSKTDDGDDKKAEDKKAEDKKAEKSEEDSGADKENGEDKTATVKTADSLILRYNKPLKEEK